MKKKILPAATFNRRTLRLRYNKMQILEVKRLLEVAIKGPSVRNRMDKKEEKKGKTFFFLGLDCLK